MSNRIFSHWRKGSLVAFTVLASLAFPLAVRAATVTGMNGVIASEYDNPFDPDGDGVTSGSEATIITSGPIGGGSTSTSNPIRIVSREDHRNSSGGGRIQSNDGSATMGFFQYQAANPFTVGTAISVQSVGSTFDNPMPFDLLLGGQSVQTGLGTQGTHPYAVTTLDPATTSVSQLRIEGEMVTAGATATFFDMQEVLLLPDQLEVIGVTAITASDPATGGTFGSKPGIHDFNGTTGSGAAGGWAIADPNPDRFFQLDFSGDEEVAALVLANYENIAVDGRILDDSNTEIASFTMSSGSLGEILAIRFDTPVTTSLLRVEFDGTGAIGMREAIAFSLLPPPPVPEPSTAMLLGLGLLALAKCRRRRNS